MLIASSKILIIVFKQFLDIYVTNERWKKKGKKRKERKKKQEERKIKMYKKDM